MPLKTSLNDMSAFDILKCPLAGTSLIEASAGSGKTWNICAIYICLLIESKLKPDQILVITFTNAATAELRQRIRQKIISLIFSLQQWIDSKQTFASNDILFNYLIKRYSKKSFESDNLKSFAENDTENKFEANTDTDTDIDADWFGFNKNQFSFNEDSFNSIEQVIACLRFALNMFDQAAILTIHGFCQRILSDIMLVSFEEKSIDLIADDLIMREELAAQFWERKIEPIALAIDGFTAWLANNQATPIYLAEILQQHLKQPLSRLIINNLDSLVMNQLYQSYFNNSSNIISITNQHRNELDDHYNDGNQNLAKAELFDNNEWLFKLTVEAKRELVDCLKLYEKAARCWHEASTAIIALIREKQSALHASIYKTATLQITHAAWHRYLTGNDCWQFAPLLLAKPYLYSQTYLSSKLKKKQALISHLFFGIADTLLTKLNKADQIYHQLWLGLNQVWLCSAPEKLDKQKDKSLKLTFDDLLRRAYLIINKDQSLQKSLRQQYPAALVDEFQDTDPLQCAILNLIYPKIEQKNAVNLKKISSSHERSDHSLLNIKVAEPKKNSFSENINLPNQLVDDNPYALYLVGDPKQAIYSFRAADIHSYLEARTRANFLFTLFKNWRSNPSLIAACNRLFSHNSIAFVEPSLSFIPAQYPNITLSSNIEKQNKEKNHGLTNSNQDMQIWLLPNGLTNELADGSANELDNRPNNEVQNKEILNRDAAFNAAGIATADEIVKLLNDGLQNAQFTHSNNGEKQNSDFFQANDIVVLVRTHQQAAAIKRLLDERNVASIIDNQLSIFQTIDADICYSVLAAIETPANLTAVKTALSNDWFDLSGEALLELTENAEALVWVDIFIKLKTQWRAYGFSVMWNTLLNQLRVLQRISCLPNAKRRLNHILHLGEILQNQASVCSKKVGQLSHWLSMQKAETDLETHKTRLESDQDLVQIMTIHKAKGLEFPIVFLPCLFDICPQTASNSVSLLLSLHSFRITNQFFQCLSNNAKTAQENIIKAIIAKKIAIEDTVDQPILKQDQESLNAYLSQQTLIDDAAEAMRLIYVSLTRASRRCYLVAGVFSKGGIQRSRVITATSLNWLSNKKFDNWLDWQNAPPDVAEVYQFWLSMNSSEIAVSFLPEPSHVSYFAHDENEFNSKLKTLSRHLAPNWQTSSFSQMVSPTIHFITNSAANSAANINTGLNIDAIDEVYIRNGQPTISIKNTDVFEHETHKKKIDVDISANQKENLFNTNKGRTLDEDTKISTKTSLKKSSKISGSIKDNNLIYYHDSINQNTFTNINDNQNNKIILSYPDEINTENGSNIFLHDAEIDFASINWLPKGVCSGIFLHRLYDKTLNQPIIRWHEIIDKMFDDFCYQWPELVKSNNELESWQRVMTIDKSIIINSLKNHLNQIISIQLPVILTDFKSQHVRPIQKNLDFDFYLDADFDSHFCLADVPSQQAYSEVRFIWKYDGQSNLISYTDNPAFIMNRLIKLCQKYKYHLPDNINLMRLNLGKEEGFIQGEIDWLFFYQNRFYFIDWKSNQNADIDNQFPLSLDELMVENGYWLQALIYTLAIHRQLRLSIRDYDYEKHFGGFFYIFIRNLKGSTYGDFAFNPIKAEKPLESIIGNRPPFALIDALDKLFSADT